MEGESEEYVQYYWGVDTWRGTRVEISSTVKDSTNGVEWSQWKWFFQIAGLTQGWGKVPKVRNAGGTRNRVWMGMGEIM